MALLGVVFCAATCPEIPTTVLTSLRSVSQWRRVDCIANWCNSWRHSIIITLHNETGEQWTRHHGVREYEEAVGEDSVDGVLSLKLGRMQKSNGTFASQNSTPVGKQCWNVLDTCCDNMNWVSLGRGGGKRKRNVPVHSIQAYGGVDA